MGRCSIFIGKKQKSLLQWRHLENSAGPEDWRRVMRKTAAVIGIGFLSTVWLTGCVSDEMIIQANWKMQLPDGGKELYPCRYGGFFSRRW